MGSEKKRSKSAAPPPLGGGNASAPTSPGRLNPDVKAFQIPDEPGYQSQSAPTSPDRSSFGAAFDPRERLLRHLTYYFSMENLMKDGFLLSNMNSEFFVKCSLIANFFAVKKLTTDLDLVVELLRQCPNVQVTADGAMVRPIVMPPQAFGVAVGGAAAAPFVAPTASIVFGDALSEATQDEVMALFEGSSPPMALARNESNAWLAKFPTEEVAKSAAAHVVKAKYKDVAIEAEVQVDKSATAGVYGQPFDPRFQQQFYSSMYPGYGYVPGMPVYGYPFVYDSSMQGYPRPPGQAMLAPGRFPANGPSGGHGSQRREGRGSGKGRNSGSRSNSTEFVRPQSVGHRDRHGEDGGGGKMSRRNSDRSDGNFGGGRREGGGKGNKKKSGGDGKREVKRKADPAPQLAPENFPALPGGPGPKSAGTPEPAAPPPAAAAWNATDGSGGRPMADIVKGLGAAKDADATEVAATANAAGVDSQAAPTTAPAPVGGEGSDGPQAHSNAGAAIDGSHDKVPKEDGGARSAPPTILDDDVSNKAGTTVAAVVAGAPLAAKKTTLPPAVAPTAVAPVATVSKPAPNGDMNKSTEAASGAAEEPISRGVATGDSKSQGPGPAVPPPEGVAAAAPWAKPSGGGKPSFAEMLKRQNEAKK